jgi:hypothetical protein
MTYEYHEAANIFPMEAETLGELAEDIKQHGLLNPIELYKGKILDGRRRYQACQMAGVAPHFCEPDINDPIAYVASLNLHRRHLTPNQRAMIGDDIREIYAKAARERQHEGQIAGGLKRHGKSSLVSKCAPSTKGKSRDLIGHMMGVSGQSIDRARTVKQNGTPELVEAARTKDLKITTAALATKLPPEQQKEVARTGKLPKSKPEDIPEGVSRGVGVRYANEAIDKLKKIPPNDGLRARGFQIVSDWVRRNK